MKFYELEAFAQKYPDKLVTLFFHNPVTKQEGTATMCAKKAVNPCRSMRYFAPEDKSPADIGWPVPYWFAEEVVAVIPTSEHWEHAKCLYCGVENG